LVLPLVTISMAFAMFFGIGSANMISMRLGQARRAEAENALNHGLCLLVLAGILIMAAELVFLENILSLLGAQEGSAALGYARNYYRIILYGHVFFLVGFGMSHCTRAQGFPLITMIGMFVGAGMNMILDPLFIFVFEWGVEGAAWATIISQFAAMLWILKFTTSKKAVVRIRLGTFKPSAEIILHIMSFGSAAALLQLAMSGVQLVYNTNMGWYGATALGVANGGDIALSGMNIVGSVTMLIIMPVFGINQGVQPILGFNYGAKKFHRVRRAYLLAVAAATSISTLGFLVCQIFPTGIVLFFAPGGSAELMRFAVWAMRVQLLILPLNGFQIVSTNMFAVTGRPKISILFSMLRQVIILIPCMFIFGRIWGLWGVTFAAPVADLCAVILTVVMVGIEMRELKREGAVRS
ncbi:MAG: MATE family efflux transporter, partial [Spirochaetales bacterium]|nr:MATE family efflux transporter [Spirochaetales bacterium]